MTVVLPLLTPIRSADRADLPQVDARQRAQLPVVLVSMPFLEISWPSIQIGLLAAILRQHSYPVRTLHANLDFAARIGVF